MLSLRSLKIVLTGFLFLCVYIGASVATLSGQTSSSPPATPAPAAPALIIDTADLKNEIMLVRAHIDALEKQEQEHFSMMRDLSSRLQTIMLSLFSGIGLLLALITFFQTRAVDKATDRSMQAAEKVAEKSMQRIFDLAEERIKSTADMAIQRIEGKNESLDALEKRILGTVHSTFDPPGAIKREILNSVVRYLRREEVITEETAERIRLYIMQQE